MPSSLDCSGWNFGARMIYNSSGRMYSLDYNKRYAVTVDYDGSWAVSGPALTIEAGDDVRMCIVTIGLEKFTNSFFDAWRKFCRFDVEYVGKGESHEERLADRNVYLAHNVKYSPRLLEQLKTQLEDLASEVSLAQAKLVYLSAKE